jgi:hypothetical protein
MPPLDSVVMCDVNTGKGSGVIYILRPPHVGAGK